METKEKIYEAISGMYAGLENYEIEGIRVKDEYGPEGDVRKIYEQVFEARERLNKRLGVDDDKDVHEVVSGMEDIMKIVGMKMYEYGYLMGRRNK